MAGELAAPADPAVAAVADAARAAHGSGVCAVLFYGSCRRDGYREGLLVDLYLIVDDYASVHRSRLMRWLNRLIPPNVYYVEAEHVGGNGARQVRPGEPGSARAAGEPGHAQSLLLGPVRPAHRACSGHVTAGSAAAIEAYWCRRS